MENCPSKFTGIAQIFTSLHVLEFGKTHALLESWCMVIIVLVKPLRFHRKLFNRCLLVLHNQTIPKLLSPNLPTKFNSPFQRPGFVENWKKSNILAYNMCFVAWPKSQKTTFLMFQFNCDDVTFDLLPLQLLTIFSHLVIHLWFKKNNNPNFESPYVRKNGKDCFNFFAVVFF